MIDSGSFSFCAMVSPLVPAVGRAGGRPRISVGARPGKARSRFARIARDSLATRSRSLLVVAELREDRVVLERRRVLHDLDPGGDVAQEAAHDLAAARLRQSFRETDLGRARELPDLPRDVLHQLLPQEIAGLVPAADGDERADRLAGQLVGPPDD